MHYVFNEKVQEKSNKVLWYFAVAGWVMLVLVIIAGYICQRYGAQLW